MTDKESILLSDLAVTGDIVEKEKITIDAKINGNVKADEIATFENSNIKGDVDANRIKLGGKLQGNVKSGKTEILKTADIEGNLSQDTLSIEEGAALKINTETKR